jgi:glutamyl-tRNA synthetase
LQRSTEESTRSILDGLKWLELEHDEEIVYQSNNADKHRAAALKLLEEGKAYRDFTPKEERAMSDVKAAIVERAREQKICATIRFGICQKKKATKSGGRRSRFAIRLKVAESGKTNFEDAVYGPLERDYSEIEDLVLLRSDGHPLYNLAVVCDDIEMEITHVIRGQDHLTNTHKQILLYEALGAEKPTFAHLPLILAPNKGKLSKRKHGEVVSMTTYRDAGFLAAAFRNFLVLLGWSAGEEKEIYTVDELVEKFSLDHIHKNNAVFNFDANDPKHWTDDKAIWMNAEYVRTMPVADLLPFVKAELKAAKLWRDEYEDDDREWFEATVDLIRQRFFTLKDFSQQGRAFFSEDYDFDEAAITKNLKKFPDLRMWLPELADRFEAVEDFTHDNIETIVKAFTEEKGTKMGVIMNGARALLTGLAVGPSMLAVFETLGKEKSVRRLKSQVVWNQ